MSGFGYNVLGFGANASTSTGSPPDDEFNRVSFLSHFDGANNGVNNAFDDGSASNHTITANGNVTQGSFGPFARPDGEFGVTMPTGPIIENNYAGSVEVASHSDFTLSGQYTIEFFVNSTTLKNPGDASNIGLFAVGPENNADSMNLFFAGTTVRYWTSTAYNTFGSSSDIVTNTWVHIAVCRNSSNVITCFVNGTALGTTFSDTTTPQGQVVIGAELYQTARYNSLVGSISNFRILNGTCLYTSNFTAPTSALTAITNTKLLTCQSNRFVDNSASGHTVTVTGAPEVSAFGPFLTSAVYDAAVNGASAYIAAGDSDYLSMPAQTIPTGSFTVEGWYYLDGTQSDSTIFAQGSSGNAARTFVGIEAVSSVQSLRFQLGSSLVNGPAAVANQWTHFCATYNGSAIELFQNGVSAGTTSRSGDAQNVAMVIGRLNTDWGDSYGVKGYISDIRVSSVVRQSSNFTPPTAPLTNVDSNVKFLANMADGQAIDSAAQNNLTLLGNTDTSTGQAKFGNTSLFYDGSGDGAYYANGAALGTGDWTIETFLWVNDFDADLGVFQYGGADGALGSMVLTNQKIRVLSSAVAARLDTSGTINAQTWYHVAYVSYNGTLSVYINGTADSTTYDASSTTWTFTDTNIYVGARYYSSAVQLPFDGYLDEFRVSHFARYTSDFTAPSAAFADKGQ